MAQTEKDNIQNLLLNIGRKLVSENGTEALTARKLSEASGCSVGAIYNQFSNMDNFIVIQNYMTLDELANRLDKVELTGDAFADLNLFLDTFVEFVLENKNLWFMLYSFHLRNNGRQYSYFYLRRVVKIISLIDNILRQAVPNMERPERLLSSQVLWLTLFALSSLLTKDILDSFSKINRRTICQIMINTYLAGLTVLEEKDE